MGLNPAILKNTRQAVNKQGWKEITERINSYLLSWDKWEIFQIAFFLFMNMVTYILNIPSPPMLGIKPKALHMFGKC